GTGPLGGLDSLVGQLVRWSERRFDGGGDFRVGHFLVRRNRRKLDGEGSARRGLSEQEDRTTPQAHAIRIQRGRCSAAGASPFEVEQVPVREGSRIEGPLLCAAPAD